jgi:hypothetical protein
MYMMLPCNEVHGFLCSFHATVGALYPVPHSVEPHGLSLPLIIAFHFVIVIPEL